MTSLNSVVDIPPPLADLAQQAVGAITSAVDRSWPRENSAVWEITTAAHRQYFVKQHPSPRFHQREVTAYQKLVPSLGPGRAPELITADQNLAAIVITGLPGQVVKASHFRPSRSWRCTGRPGGFYAEYTTCRSRRPASKAPSVSSNGARNIFAAPMDYSEHGRSHSYGNAPRCCPPSHHGYR
jgi:hypothetical protein